MPHTNRKKKSGRGDGGVKVMEQKRVVVHTKRSEVVDDSGWTHVVDTPRTRRGTVSKYANLQHAGDFEVNGVAFVNRTLPEIKEECQYWRNNWDKSDASANLKAILEEKTSTRKLEISNIVVLGLGSLQIARMEGRRASCTQLAALDHTLEFLLPDKKLRVAFQDPIYTDMDKEFLTSRGQYTVEDPAGFQEIGEDTLVYAIHCYGDVYKKMSEGKKPAVLISTDMDNFGKFNLSESSEETTKLFERMVEGYEKIDFPQLRHDFSDTKIYWRKTEDISEVKPEVITTAEQSIEKAPEISEEKPEVTPEESLVEKTEENPEQRTDEITA